MAIQSEAINSSNNPIAPHELSERAESEGAFGNQRVAPVATTQGALFPVDAGSQWDISTKRTVLVILLVAAVGVFWISQPVIPLLVVAGIIAYILNPIVDICERLHIPRGASTAILFMLLLVGLILTPVLLAPILVQQLTSLNFDVPSTALALLQWISSTFNRMPETVEILGFEVPISGLTEQIESSFQEFRFIPTLAEILNYIQQLISTATNVVGSTAAIGVSVVGSIFQVFVAILVIFFLSLYLTKDAPTIRAYIEGLFPSSYQSEWIDLLRRMGFIWQAFFRGQIMLSITVGVATWLALSLAGMPGALILGIVAGALEIIPTLGPVLAMIPAVIIALIQGSTVLSDYGINNFGFALVTLAIYFIIQQVENNILVPRIIGGGINLHPIVVICGVAVGYNVAGVLGAFFAAPVIASLRVLGSYIHAKLLDYPPFLGRELPPMRRRQLFSYHRTVRGDELVGQNISLPRVPSASAADLVHVKGQAGAIPALENKENSAALRTRGGNIEQAGASIASPLAT
jgi:predicted PurR-regulated permease PerM